VRAQAEKKRLKKEAKRKKKEAKEVNREEEREETELSSFHISFFLLLSFSLFFFLWIV
jgi:hypothetical protein